MLFTVSMKSDKDYRRAYNKGKFCVNDAVTAYFYPNKLSLDRLGITTGKKIGNAVKRNRARRIIRAAYRECEKDFPIGYDVVFVARAGIEGKKSTDIEEFIRTRLLKEMAKPFEKSMTGNNKKNFTRKK